MRLSTRHKIAIARIVSTLLIAGRRLGGLGPMLTARREGINWQLDLREGIDLAIYLRRFERDEIGVVGRYVRSGATVIDIGANIGFHTLLMARQVGTGGKVIAIEPTSYAFGKQEANIRLNPSLKDRVRSHQLLLVDGSGTASSLEAIYSSWPLAQGDDHHPVHLGRAMPIDQARVLTLDAFWAENDFGRVDFIKLDVDGNEASVLRGARELLLRDRPEIMLEVAPDGHEGSGFEEMIEELARAGYRLRHLRTLEDLPLDAKALRARCGVGKSMNILASVGA